MPHFVPSLVAFYDREIYEPVAALLREEGFDVFVEGDSDKAVMRIVRMSPDAVIIAEDMPPADGVELVPLLRQITRVPLIVMGAGGEAAIVNALLKGADLYIKTPDNNREMLSRIRAVLRRSELGKNWFGMDEEKTAGSAVRDTTITLLPRLLRAWKWACSARRWPVVAALIHLRNAPGRCAAPGMGSASP